MAELTPLNTIASEGKLTLGLVFPLESYAGSVPQMQDQEELARQAEEAGFKALWFRDVPFHDPTFGDAGQMYDPWVYITHIMNQTKDISLATGSIILPLRHPVHTIKSINSIQNLSGGRLIVGVASGDRPIEYPALGRAIGSKSELFRDSYRYLQALQEEFPTYKSEYFGQVVGNIDILPKSHYKTPFLVTGHSGQSLDWIAQHADGWLYYPRNIDYLKKTMGEWHNALQQAKQSWKPHMQSLYIDLVIDKPLEPSPIHLGFKCNPDYLTKYFDYIRNIGVNHVIINLKFSSLPIKQTIEILKNTVLPHFN